MTRNLFDKCYNCGNPYIEEILNYEIEDFDTEEMKIRNGFICTICDCFHYIDENNNFCYEYMPNIKEESTFETARMLKSDQEVIREEKLKTSTQCK